jgi:hypothetical protein
VNLPRCVEGKNRERAGFGAAFATSRGLRRSTGRQSTTTAEPSLRRAKKSGACETVVPAASVQCSQNGWGRDTDHGRIEIQMQHVIALQPGLKPHVATRCG